MSSSLRPSNAAGRSNGMPLSSLLVYAPEICGSPQGVRGGTYPFTIFASGLSCDGRSLWLIGAAVRGEDGFCANPVDVPHDIPEAKPAARTSLRLVIDSLQHARTSVLRLSPIRSGRQNPKLMHCGTDCRVDCRCPSHSRRALPRPTAVPCV